MENEAIIEFKLKSGETVMVNQSDYPLISQYNWYKEKHSNTTYARAYIGGKLTKMHRLILGISDSKIPIDHKDGNGLNNTRSNIRACTQGDNLRNRAACGKSKFIGVSPYRNRGWFAKINTDGKQKHIGIFDSEEDAAIAYNKAAIASGNEFFRINQI